MFEIYQIKRILTGIYVGAWQINSNLLPSHNRLLPSVLGLLIHDDIPALCTDGVRFIFCLKNSSIYGELSSNLWYYTVPLATHGIVPWVLNFFVNSGITFLYSYFLGKKSWFSRLFFVVCLLLQQRNCLLHNLCLFRHQTV